MSIEIKIPPLGESVTGATVAKWHKGVGDSVNTDELIIELETDKVTLEVSAPASGTITEITAGEGETVQKDALLARMEEGPAAAAGYMSQHVEELQRFLTEAFE